MRSTNFGEVPSKFHQNNFGCMYVAGYIVYTNVRDKVILYHLVISDIINLLTSFFIFIFFSNYKTGSI